MKTCKVMTDREIEDRMIFASSCVESAARALGISAKEAYQRMKRVNLINGYILKHYEVIHSESRKHVTEDVVGCLLDWEQRKLGKEA
ncbi:DUF3791 domain-containing protein [Bacteroides sp. UBA939]|uniref:DUF3791 domain-containing protein n=1 Tax=Bacteroides sp. UBA939 TaxID=1946092 RepID=UPI0025C0B700|nr:DUF3791 domain-containing protein [Bacteroides sp. UBA939]